ncbi:CBU_0592 family membrane protein [Cellulomonas chengniuliangii]|uniref:CBU-0592-like domain-containing protein n=1 Tax=Cellulomonas chengniuliangii TaxID=2968084 RepID=A0ABY5KXE2_9CELL|nr:hypothetical protein [Cellulomonas chengniuliangii]MCC2309265.1 hypothetical protein [Cellulomonas chengniuliangii]MCC2318609.1 hypothetical protein [Cellulomonas chengniuliangii]UUI75166.1 hypothetical protein NP064_15555 [Cellulomonas chengniuliangii]
MDVVITSLGWLGAIICVTAYGLVSRGTWSASSTRYQVANIAGALLLCVVAARSQVWPSVASNIAWALIGAHALTALVRGRQSPADAAATAAEHSAAGATSQMSLLPTQATAATAGARPMMAPAGSTADDLAHLPPSSVTLVA